MNYNFLFKQFDYKDFEKKLNKLNDEQTRQQSSKEAKEFIKSKLDPHKLINQFKEIILKDV